MQPQYSVVLIGFGVVISMQADVRFQVGVVWLGGSKPQRKTLVTSYRKQSCLFMCNHLLSFHFSIEDLMVQSRRQ